MHLRLVGTNMWRHARSTRLRLAEVVLAAMTDAWMPPIFCRVEEPLAVPTIDLTIHFRSRPTDPLDHCFARFHSPLAAEGYLVEHGTLWASDGRVLAESRQLAVVA